jgi:hypothetical protein
MIQISQTSQINNTENQNEDEKKNENIVNGVSVTGLYKWTKDIPMGKAELSKIKAFCNIKIQNTKYKNKK